MKVTISNSAAQVIGLDDFARYPDLKRSWTKWFKLFPSGAPDFLVSSWLRAP